MARNDKQRIVVVDDHPIVRDGIIRLIETSNDMHVCGDTGDGSRVIGMVADLKPDAVVLDLTLEESTDGMALIGMLAARFPKLPVLVLSMHDELTHAQHCIRAGARGYLMKKCASKEIIRALRDVLRGNVYLSESAKSQMIGALAGLNRSGDRSAAVLSPREFQIYRLYGQGLQTAHIATKLQCSPKTVETHSLRIRRKLNLHNVNELVASAGAYMGSADNLP